MPPSLIAYIYSLPAPTKLGAARGEAPRRGEPGAACHNPACLLLLPAERRRLREDSRGGPDKPSTGRGQEESHRRRRLGASGPGDRLATPAAPRSSQPARPRASVCPGPEGEAAARALVSLDLAAAAAAPLLQLRSQLLRRANTQQVGAGVTASLPISQQRLCLHINEGEGPGPRRLAGGRVWPRAAP